MFYYYAPPEYLFFMTYMRIGVATIWLLACLFLLLHFIYTYLRWQSEPASPPLFNFIGDSRPHITFRALLLSFAGSVLIGGLFDPLTALISFIGSAIFSIVIHGTWGSLTYAPAEPAHTSDELSDVAKDVLYKHFTKKPDGT
jgi:hypothetical protein